MEVKSLDIHIVSEPYDLSEVADGLIEIDQIPMALGEEQIPNMYIYIYIASLQRCIPFLTV